MKRVLVGECAPDHVFQLSDPDARSESEFEFAVAKALSCLFGAYRCVVFGGSFRYDERLSRPDLALVALDYSHWFVIEVELTSHSFHAHVLPQVLAFQYGKPQPDCVGILSRELQVSASQVQTLLEHVPRQAVVVANRRLPSWEGGLGAYGIPLLGVDILRSETGREAYEIEGSLEVIEESLGFGTYSATDRSLRFSRTLLLQAGTLQLDDPDGALATWTVARGRDATWITKDVGTPDIPDGAYVQIIRRAGGGLSLRRPR